MKNNTLITLLLSVFIALLGIGIIVPVMPVFARELGAGGFALGMIIASQERQEKSLDRKTLPIFGGTRKSSSF